MASEASVGSSFDTPIGDSLDLAASGEPRVALENFLSNLYEFDVAISAQEYDTLAALARRLQVPEAQWTFIEELRT